MTNQAQKPIRSKIIEPSRHDRNFLNYITEYASTNELPMRGKEWEAAKGAAERLDYTGERAAAPKMRLIPPQGATGLLGRLAGLFRGRERIEYLSEMDHIRAFLRLAPEAAAQQSEINWRILRNGFPTSQFPKLLKSGLSGLCKSEAYLTPIAYQR